MELLSSDELVNCVVVKVLNLFKSLVMFEVFGLVESNIVLLKVMVKDRFLF